jgi:hypothetical protein
MDVVYYLKTYKVHTGFVYHSHVHHVYVPAQDIKKKIMMSGIKQCTSCTLRGCFDRCATSINTLACNLYLRQYKSSYLFVKSHLVAGVERPAPALRSHPLQPCRRRAGPPLGFRGSQAWLGSTAWILLCGDLQPPD